MIIWVTHTCLSTNANPNHRLRDAQRRSTGTVARKFVDSPLASGFSSKFPIKFLSPPGKDNRTNREFDSISRSVKRIVRREEGGGQSEVVCQRYGRGIVRQKLENVLVAVIKWHLSANSTIGERKNNQLRDRSQVAVPFISILFIAAFNLALATPVTLTPKIRFDIQSPPDLILSSSPRRLIPNVRTALNP